MVPVLEEELAGFTTKYPWRTGLALDQTHPKHIGMISREGLFVFCYFFYCVEAAGLWPDAMNLYAFFLMLKATGGVPNNRATARAAQDLGEDADAVGQGLEPGCPDGVLRRLLGKARRTRWEESS